MGYIITALTITAITTTCYISMPVFKAEKTVRSVEITRIDDVQKNNSIIRKYS